MELNKFRIEPKNYNFLKVKMFTTDFMYSQEKNPTNQFSAEESLKITRFIQTIFSILKNPSLSDIICWNPGGERFLVKQPQTFADKVLQQYFGHRNLTSFIRQLYFYDFKRCACENNQFSFFHPLFNKQSSSKDLSMLRRKKVKACEPTIGTETSNFPQKKILIEKTNEAWSCFKAQPSTPSQFPALKTENFTDYLPCPTSKAPESGSVSISYSQTSAENLLVLEDALRELRAIRQKLEEENSQEDNLLGLEFLEYC